MLSLIIKLNEAIDNNTEAPEISYKFPGQVEDNAVLNYVEHWLSARKISVGNYDRSIRFLASWLPSELYDLHPETIAVAAWMCILHSYGIKEFPNWRETVDCHPLYVKYYKLYESHPELGDNFFTDKQTEFYAKLPQVDGNEDLYRDAGLFDVISYLHGNPAHIERLIFYYAIKCPDLLIKHLRIHNTVEAAFVVVYLMKYGKVTQGLVKMFRPDAYFESALDNCVLPDEHMVNANYENDIYKLYVSGKYEEAQKKYESYLKYFPKAGEMVRQAQVMKEGFSSVSNSIDSVVQNLKALGIL